MVNWRHFLLATRTGTQKQENADPIANDHGTGPIALFGWFWATGPLRIMKQMALPESTWLRLQTQLDCLPTLLAEEALEHRPSPDQWSAREHLAHLARYQNVFLGRWQRLRTEDHPVLPRYRAEEDPEWTAWAHRSAAEIFEDLRRQRRELVRQAERLPEGELARTGIHSRFGALTMGQWLEFFLLHEAHHLLAVFQRTRE